MLARGRFMRLFPALACLFAIHVIPAAAAEPENVIYVYTRENYFDPEVVGQFEERTGCRVDFDYYDSVDTMFERIKTGSTGYDLIVAPTVAAADLNARDLLMHLNRTLIPNFRHLDTSLLHPFPDLEMRYHAPYTWAITGVGYRKDLVPPPVESWGIYASPALKERGAMLNDARYVIGAALKHLGYSINTTNQDEIEGAYRVLLEWRNAVVLFGVDEPRRKLESGQLAFIQAYSGDIATSMEADANISFDVPREGSILNSDCFVIPVDTENPDMAHAFINHMFNPRVAAANMRAIRYYMPNRAALSQLPRDLRESPLFRFPRELLAKSEAVRDVGQAQAHYDRVWAALLMQE